MSDSTRREFMTRSGCGLLSGAALLTGFEQFSLMSLFAEEARRNNADYKALVCVFLFGGNDSNNMVIPYDNYADYAAVRSGAAFAIPQDQLLQINPPSAGATYGLHTNMPEMQILFNQMKLAIVVNIGTLVQPLTREDYLAGAPRPSQLFSHSDQQTESLTARSSGASQTGWGGRTADRVLSSETFPIITSVAGVTIYGTAGATRPLVISPAPTPLNQTLRLLRAEPALEALLALDSGKGVPTLVGANSRIVTQAIANSRSLDTDPLLTTVFPNTALGNQLKQIAKLISLKDTLGMRRQIFFAARGGFDTHTGQATGQGNLLREVSQALSAFYDATIELGLADRVTTFTLSDFTRTFRPGGGMTGTDHAWGGHQLVLGGSVLGGDFYGTYPTLAPGGPDDTDMGTGARGRWIPTIAIDQYGATLGQWLGLTADDVPMVFPNIGSFAANNLGFMQAI
ncbi:MAG: DUF1501 domain-containing protein [Acidobacteria bacterium]|nr:DUF1501 domain-containing protein [Acidobacteriota bacterium]MBI3656067.1 DUF1501 domain-containing protein [Acidobacteriota bacterium]